MEKNLRKIENLEESIARATIFLEEYSGGSNKICDVEKRLEFLEQCYEKFEGIQNEIEGTKIKDDNFLEEQNGVRQRFENNYLTACGLASTIIKMYSTVNEIKPERAAQNIDRTQNIKLPTLRLPDFDGDYKKWLFFRDSFKSTVHDNATISTIDKFQYLKSSLKGDAQTIVESIDLTDANYITAWNLLNQRFNNKKAIVKKHIQLLMDVQPVIKESSVEIRKIVDNVQKNLHVLRSFDQPVGEWDQLIIFLIETKLDITTRRDWENESKGLPTLNVFINFLEHRCQMLEAIQSISKGTDQQPTTSKTKVNIHGQKSSLNQRSTVSLTAADNQTQCYMCKGDHRIYRCEEFLKMTQEERKQQVNNLKLCFNCLSNTHTTNRCTKRSCYKCKKRHNTLLHPDDNQYQQSTSSETSSNNTTPSTSLCQCVVDTQYQQLSQQGPSHHDNNCYPLPSINHSSSTDMSGDRNKTQNNTTVYSNDVQPIKNYACNLSRRQVFLSTVLINVADVRGSNHICRALLDSGSQANFVRESFFKQLGFKGNNVTVPIVGISQLCTKVTMSATMMISSRHTDYTKNLEFLVMPKLTNDLPSASVDISMWNIPSTISLADPYFHQPGRIDILLGAQVFFELLRTGQISLHQNLPILQNTALGWVVSGICSGVSTQPITSCHAELDSMNSGDIQLQQQMAKFWEVEDFHVTHKVQSAKEQECEKFFEDTTVQDSSGRFIVKLPLKDDPSVLGDSLVIAEKRFRQLERRLTADSKFRQMYCDFVNEYISLGHMQEVIADQSLHFGVYLPHHGVLKENSSTTKLRVVFDASAKTSSGKSLNDILLVGPKIQDDLINIVMRFRTYPVVITGDIAKMYRQVNVHDSDHHLQRILWREHPNEPIRHFNLTTVTYGTASAPYLATKCLQKLAINEGQKFPRASKVALTDFYVDDIITGAQTVEDAQQLQQELSQLLQLGQFPLRKWSSNRIEVLSNIPVAERELQDSMMLDSKETIGILGLRWLPLPDQFKFNVGSFHAVVTKRTILSDVSKLFDPLGLMGPIIITAKIIMQDIWKLKMQWDDPLPESIHLKWEEYKRNIVAIDKINISRCVITVSSPYTVKLVGFSDASEQAYGAAVYIVATDTHGNTSSHLLCAKSRVAPLKRLSIPRLELCGALLLTELIEKVSAVMNIDIAEVQAYTDSMIVLYWLTGDPCKQKTFVGNRVAQIKGILSPDLWHHVKSEDNPADLISRGVCATDLIENSLWWYGPSWLKAACSNNSHDDISQLDQDDLKLAQSEEKMVIDSFSLNFEKQNVIDDFFDHFNSLSKIQNIVAYCLRISSIAKKDPNRQRGCILSVSELQSALFVMVKHVQRQEFNKEIRALEQQHPVSPKSKLLSLNPFLDSTGILRVGGRLGRSELQYGSKYPAILPAKHRFTTLLFKREHKRLLHIGPQSLLASIRLQFWPIDGRNLAKKITHQCLVCYRFRPEVRNQIMGHLPSTRVTPARPFLNSGVDYGGPIMTLQHKGRPSKKNAFMKSYIALFVCFSTKAIHIEVVSDLSTSAFIAAFRRFTSRRGLCISISSDNGTNFVGADRELQKFVNSTAHNDKMSQFLTSEGITWKFIPPGSPHMGGIWEAGIKSTKHHVRRLTDKNTYYTFEELTTLMSQIEACLNSRPITPISSDPNDYVALTPGHFLIGAPLKSLPDVDLTDVPDNRLKKFKLIQKQLQLFWRRYITEYVTTLQNRTKWKTTRDNLQINDMVLVRDDNLPPTHWVLGRVKEVHRGPDNLVRVVTIKTAKGDICRNIVKLCKLPVNDEPV